MFGFGKKNDMQKVEKQLKKVNKNLKKINGQYAQINETLIASTNKMLAQMK